MKSKDIGNKINNRKEQNIELIIITVIVGLGVNLLATALINMLPVKNNIYYLLIIGVILSLIVIIVYVLIKVKSLNSSTNIKGTFIFNKVIKDFIKIPDYKLSEDMKKYIKALFLESKNDENKFNKCKYLNTDERIEPNDDENDYFKNLINNLIEYLILKELADSLTDYYFKNTDKIVEYNIENIPKSFNKNQFLKIISKDISKRKVFNKEDTIQAIISRIKNNGEKEIVSSHTSEGYIYEKFELKLPKHTKLSKKYFNQLLIENKYYKINIKWLFNYYGGSVDNEFYEYVIKKERDWEYDEDFSIDIQIDISIKPFLIFNKNKQKHYDILDIIINNFFEYFDYNNYLAEMNWNLAKTIFKYNNREL